jgi:hypothetical protein
MEFLTQGNMEINAEFIVRFFAFIVAVNVVAKIFDVVLKGVR